MGLDQYLLGIKQATEEGIKSFVGRSLDDICKIKCSDGYSFFLIPENVAKSPEYSDITGFLLPLQYKAEVEDTEKLKKDYGIPADACRTYACSNQWRADDIFTAPDGKEYPVKYDIRDYIMLETVDGYIYKSKALKYWRKDYRIEEMFLECYEKPMLNCGLHAVPVDFLWLLYDEGELRCPPDSMVGDDEIIVYHPWW